MPSWAFLTGFLMAKARFNYEKRDGCLHLSNLQWRVYGAWVDGLPDGQIVDAEFRRHRHPKTKAQLGYWYGVLMHVASDALLEAGYDTLFDVAVGKLKTGVATTPDTCDLLFKTLFAASRQMDHAPQKRAMTDGQMGELIDYTKDWLARNLGVIAPLPETDDA